MVGFLCFMLLLFFYRKRRDCYGRSFICILISQFCQRHVSRWTTLADKQVENPEFKLKGYQIALQFVPPRDLFKRSHLLSKMLLLCCESGPSFQTMASLFMCAANEIEVCEQEVRNNNSIITLTNEAQH